MTPEMTRTTCGTPTMNNALMFGNAGDERATPQEFFNRLDAEFHFTLDAAATTLNHKCPDWFGEGGLAFDALEQDWGGEESIVFLNPPYSVAAAFVAKAREEADKGAVVVLLLPVRSDTKWWHSYVWDATQHDWRPGVSTRLLAGRLNFELHVPEDIRQSITDECLAAKDQDEFLARAVKSTGLPKMAIERICQGLPDDCLLDSAPFPSCVVIFT